MPSEMASEAHPRQLDTIVSRGVPCGGNVNICKRPWPQYTMHCSSCIIPLLCTTTHITIDHPSTWHPDHNALSSVKGLRPPLHWPTRLWRSVLHRYDTIITSMSHIHIGKEYHRLSDRQNPEIVEIVTEMLYEVLSLS